MTFCIGRRAFVTFSAGRRGSRSRRARSRLIAFTELAYSWVERIDSAPAGCDPRTYRSFSGCAETRNACIVFVSIGDPLGAGSKHQYGAVEQEFGRSLHSNERS
jgi:hypothetical protein